MSNFIIKKLKIGLRRFGGDIVISGFQTLKKIFKIIDIILDLPNIYNKR